jgi:hypothetical protein
VSTLIDSWNPLVNSSMKKICVSIKIISYFSVHEISFPGVIFQDITVPYIYLVKEKFFMWLVSWKEINHLGWFSSFLPLFLELGLAIESTVLIAYLYVRVCRKLLSPCQQWSVLAQGSLWLISVSDSVQIFI